MTKAELAASGVDVEALEAAANASGAAAREAAVPRSTTVLLVKNLPYSCTEDALHDLFSGFGGAQRVVLPSTRALALVELGSKQVSYDLAAQVLTTSLCSMLCVHAMEKR